MFEKRSSTASPKQQLRKSKSLTTTGTAKNLMTVVDMTLKRRSTGCINRRSSSIYSTTSSTSNSNLGKVIYLPKKFLYFFFYLYK